MKVCIVWTICVYINVIVLVYVTCPTFFSLNISGPIVFHASELLFREMDISQIWRSTGSEASLFFVKIWEHKLSYELAEIGIVVCLIFQYKLQSI